ncbi:unnamed protein product [Lactuca virosa]|uniref:Uncharacterized protein n=1 Tax=Lactuca virosa TaxID=75947 RepID=A0AAU9LZB4_9ASTR|nr:unnamed protein product [Lactuca virosa]
METNVGRRKMKGQDLQTISSIELQIQEIGRSCSFRRWRMGEIEDKQIIERWSSSYSNPLSFTGGRRKRGKRMGRRSGGLGVWTCETFKYDRTSGRVWYITTEKIPKPLVRRLRVAKFIVSVFISSGLWTLPLKKHLFVIISIC